MFYDISSAGFANPNTLFILLLALMLDALLGGVTGLFRIFPHPVRLMGGVIGELDRRLNRESRSEKARLIRGALCVLLVLGLFAALAILILDIAARFSQGWLIELFFVAILIAQHSLYIHVRAVGRALEKKGVVGARKEVAHIVGRDPESLDKYAVARAAIESCAENFNDGVVAPVFWYLLLGLPGLFIYKAANTMDSMIGHKSPRHKSFGMVAARLDDALNYIPARISGVLLLLAAFFVPTANPLRGLKTMLRDAGNHSSSNAGWPEGASAGALDLALAGPRRYGGVTVKDSWIGKGRARAIPQDIRRMLFLFVVACLIQAGLVAGFLSLRVAGPEAITQHASDVAALYEMFRAALENILTKFF